MQRFSTSLTYYDFVAYASRGFFSLLPSPASPDRTHSAGLLAWAERVADIGHGERSPMPSRTALEVARTATSIAKVSADPHDPIGRQPGQIVSVTPDDTGRDPVVGELITSGVDEVVIRRGDHAVGEVCVHFPRAGFVVTSA